MLTEINSTLTQITTLWESDRIEEMEGSKVLGSAKWARNLMGKKKSAFTWNSKCNDEIEEHLTYQKKTAKKK